MNRERSFSAILHDGKIAIVKIEDKHSAFWTLPGGGIEAGESREEAAVREAKEEVNLEIKIIRYLFERAYSEGTEYCFLAEPYHNNHLSLGYDPELAEHEQVLKSVEWTDILDVKDDLHVSQVLKSLYPDELEKYNIKVQASADKLHRYGK